MITESVNWIGLALAGGRYRVTAKLGEGGMAHVYRAQDRNLDCDVVVKVPRLAMLEDPEFSGRFTREIRSLVKLSHPHIVKVSDVGEHEGFPYAVMQYLSGGSLRDRQLRVGDGPHTPMKIDDFRHWLTDIAQALDFIHAQHFVHRDVKPDNILFDAHGHAYLSDFGLAKVLAADTERKHKTVMTGAGVWLGTPRYIAPEIVMGRAYDGRCDQYALAVMVYELLSGRYPFDGPTAPFIFVLQTTVEPPPLTEVLPTAPRRLSAAIHRGLAKNPDQRFSSCAALARAVLDPESAPAKPRSGPNAALRTEVVAVVSCPGCQKEFALPAGAWGKRVRCPSCKHLFSAPVKPHVESTAQEKAAETASTERISARSSPKIAGWTASIPIWAWIGGGGVLVVLAVLAAAVTSRNSTVRPRQDAQRTGIGDVAAPVENQQRAAEEVRQATIPAELVGEIRRLVGHSSVVWCVAFSPDGKRALSGSSDMTMRLWNLDNSEELRKFDWYKAGVTSVAFTPDGRRAVSSSADGMVYLCDLETGALARRFPGHSQAVETVAVSPDGRRAISGGQDKLAILWNLDNGNELRRFISRGMTVWSVAFSPDGRKAIIGAGALTETSENDTLSIWNLDDVPPFESFRGFTDSVRCVAFLSDGRRAVSGSAGSSLRLWDVMSRTQLNVYAGNEKGIYGVAASPDSKRIVSGSGDGTVRVWEVDSARELARFESKQGSVWGVAISPDGRRALSASQHAVVQLWQLP